MDRLINMNEKDLWFAAGFAIVVDFIAFMLLVNVGENSVVASIPGTIIILAILALYLNAIKLLSGQKLWLSVCKLSYCLIIVLWRFICLIALIYYIGFGRHWLYGGLAFSSGLLIVLTGFGIRYHLQKRQRAILAISMVVTVFLVITCRFALMSALDLYPEEAYYWVYSLHLDWGYLDHPPMVAWLIKGGTLLLGKQEIGVRMPAMLCWVIGTVFSVAGARRHYGTAAAKVMLMLLSILPFYFMIGMMMTPDAPLYACWAGFLYFAGKAFIDDIKTAWIPAGICMGFGMLSKYTIALLGLSAVVYVITSARERRWLTCIYAYLGGILSILLFMPVVLWNYQHGWASFTFQSSRRWSDGWDFSTHKLVLALLVLVTPLGLAACYRLIRNKFSTFTDSECDSRDRFAIIFTLVPLSVFLIFSIKGGIKLNWCGPLFLAVLPLLAHRLAGAFSGSSAQSSDELALRPTVWLPNLAGSLLVLFGLSALLVTHPPEFIANKYTELVPVSWKELGRKLHNIQTQCMIDNGEKPLIMGMDKYFMTSEMTFYLDHHQLSNHAQYSFPDQKVVGRHLIGRSSLMYGFWQNPEEYIGESFILVDKDSDDLDTKAIRSSFEKLSSIHKIKLEQDGKSLGAYFWRLGEKYNTSNASWSNLHIQRRLAGLEAQ